MKKKFSGALVIVVVIIIISCAIWFISDVIDTAGAENRTEHDYQIEWCSKYGGQAEVTLRDRTRVDCLVGGYAVEMDFADKWAEAPFQAMHYARLSGLRPGVVIICRKTGDARKLQRLRDNLEFYKLQIKVWNIGCE